MRDEIVGGSLERLRAQLPLLSRERRPVVLVGPPGSGKTLVAEHMQALRPGGIGALRWLNFSLLSDRDQRLGLFGAEPPELTTTRRSILELPGTVVLKHIDCAAPYLQQKLAASVPSAWFTRMGSSKPLPLAAALVFTLRRPPEALAASGRLDPGLAQLLSGCRRVRLPGLAGRAGDIPALVRYFAAQACGAPGAPRRVAALARMITRLLRNRVFEDNVRDLITLVHAAFAGPMIPTPWQGAGFEVAKLVTMIERGAELSLPEVLGKVERCVLEHAAHVHGGRRSEIARRLGLTERDVRRKLGHQAT